jgi:hypothetical protein
LVEVNRLYTPFYRRAGYILIPEWVEFGRSVEPDETTRYADASKSLRTDLRAIRASRYAPAISRDPADFQMFYHRMYLPYATRRFGPEVIKKTRAALLRDFRSGFLLILRHGDSPVAAGLVRVDGSTVRLTTLGVLDGSDDLLRAQVSGAIDYHLHDWAAGHRMRFIAVGHTRPFPTDGVYFNKRKWLMAIAPDHDGVMSIALKWLGSEELVAHIVSACPFVYSGRLGLGVLCAHPAGHSMQLTEAIGVVNRNWTPGLASLIALCPGGVPDHVREGVRESWGSHIHLCPDWATAQRVYRDDV